MKKKIITLLQLALGIGLVVFFFFTISQSGKLDDFRNSVQSAAGNWHLMLVGICLYFLCLFSCTIRWLLLLKVQNFSITFYRALVLYFIGHFFSSFMPGATSGDLIKAIYVARETPDKKTEVVSTVFIDRILGLLGLIILAVTMMCLRLDFFMAHQATRLALVFNIGLLAVTVLGALVVFGRNLAEKWSFFTRLEERTRLGTIITKAYRAFHLCIRNRGVLSKTLLLSFMNHILIVCVIYFIGLSIGARLEFVDYLTVFPVINAIAGLPVTPGGLGMREGAAIYILGALSVPAPTALALSLLVYLITLFWAMVGGIVYMLFVLKTGYESPAQTSLDS